MIMGDIIQSRPRASSLPLIQVQVTTVLTPCPGGLISSEATKPATVQSDCSEMQVTNSVNQSLPTAIIQGTPGTESSLLQTSVFSVTVMPVVPIEGGGQMIVGVQPVVLPIVGSVDPQDVVSNTIDRIVDVKERLNEANCELFFFTEKITVNGRRPLFQLSQVQQSYSPKKNYNFAEHRRKMNLFRP